MRENAERLFCFRMPIKDKVTSKSSFAVIAPMPKASQIWSKRLMLTMQDICLVLRVSSSRFRKLHPS